MGNNRNPRIVFRCYYCGAKSTDKPSQYTRNKRHFCSMKCYADYQRDIMPKEEHNRYGTGLTEQERKVRIWCRSTTNHAISRGILQRQPCLVCGEWGEAHHPDYRQPLEVLWFCFRHHRHYHKMMDAIYENPELLEPLRGDK